MKSFTPLLILLLFFLFSNISLHAQTLEPSNIAATPSPIQTTPLGGINKYGNKSTEDWKVSISYHGIKHSPNFFESEKKRIAEMQQQQKKDKTTAPPVKSLSSATAPLQPLLEKNFAANTIITTTPPDNNIAISNNGNIVSVINSSIYFSNENGEDLGEMFLSEFFSPLGLNNSKFDPKVIYDPLADRFITVALNDRSPDNSRVMIAFSSSNNPLDEWYFYSLLGDPSGETWFDFPAIAISDTELFISGNLFHPTTGFSINLIYQVEKGQGYIGETLKSRYWSDVQTTDGESGFTIIPVSTGFGSPNEAGLYFVSNNATFSSRLYLYRITAALDNDPEMLVSGFNIPTYTAPANGLQKGSDAFISTNDARVLSSFQADSTVFFTFGASVNGSPFTSIYYGRIDLRDMSVATSSYSEAGFHCAYPSLSPFSLSPDDKTIIFAFLRTGETIYPEVRTIVCNEDFEWSNSVLIRQGETYADLDDPVEYWGDYTGISRRHNATVPEVWIAGSYGNIVNTPQNFLFPWIGKLVRNDQAQLPLASFQADQTAVLTNQGLSFSDRSTFDPKTWSWSFPGGSPETSNERDPFVSYANAGTYSVRLIVSNDLGSDTLDRTDYIQVFDLPLGEFEADKTLIAPGEKVVFTDLSMNNPESWGWVFPGGTPSFSSQQNPEVTYNNEGSFEVRLRVANPAGVSETSKSGYILVEEVMSSTQLSPALASIKIYPNPATPQDRISVEFNLVETVDLDFLLFDNAGKQIKNLLQHRSKAGVNRLSFSAEMLSAGNYVLVLQDQQNKQIGSHRLVVVK